MCFNQVCLPYCSAYRALYILNWIYRYITEDDYVQWISMSLSLSLSLFSCVYISCGNTCVCLSVCDAWTHAFFGNFVAPGCQLLYPILTFSFLFLVWFWGLLQLGYQGLSRHCSMLIFSTITFRGKCFNPAKAFQTYICAIYNIKWWSLLNVLQLEEQWEAPVTSLIVFDHG
jgi:hypothetical protein